MTIRLKRLLDSAKACSTSMKSLQHGDDVPAFMLAPVLESMNQISDLRHLGFRDKSIFSANLERDCISYLAIDEQRYGFSTGVFIIPPNKKIPLHDHPSMVGIVNVLDGQLHINSYNRFSKENIFVVQRNFSGWFHAPSVLCVNRVSGNIHELVSGDHGCIMLDTMIPNYDDDAGRPCNYYAIEDMPDSKMMARIQLKQEYETIDDCRIVSAEWPSPNYCGE